MTDNLLSRLWQRFKRWWQGSPWLAILGIGLGLLALGVLAGGPFVEHGAFTIRQFFTDLWANLGTELLSIIITVFVIEALNRRRATNERKEELIRQMGSPNNEFAIEAVRILRLKGWLEDGSLKGTLLVRANLQGARLARANLQRVKLRNAILQGASLYRANLERAVLWEANLEGVDLYEANLEGARLWRADLKGTILELANLEGAVVTCDQLREADTLQGATLPDGTKLPSDHTWREAFEVWCETVEMDERGWIVPAKSDDDNDGDNEDDD